MMTALSVFMAVAGFCGLKSIRSSETLRVHRERGILIQQLPELVGPAYEILEADQRINDEVLSRVKPLQDKVELKNQELESYPKNDAGYKQRVEVNREIRRINRQIKSIQTEIVRKTIEQTSEPLPSEVLAYHSAIMKIQELDSRGWKYSRKFAIFLRVTQVAAAIVMCLGALGIFMFGICGAITLIGST